MACKHCKVEEEVEVEEEALGALLLLLLLGEDVEKALVNDTEEEAKSNIIIQTETVKNDRCCF
jgi:hypothetical protein